MTRLKSARVEYGKIVNGSRVVTLRSGLNGKGRILLKITENPESAQSRQNTEKIIEEYANQNLYKFYRSVEA